MNRKRIAAVSLSYEDFPSFDAKLEEAARLVSLAARRGATLVVLPEVLNQWRGDGPDHPDPLSIHEMVLDDWKTSCRRLLDAAVDHGVTLTVPIYVRDDAVIYNVFYLVDGTGTVLGRYEKEHPTCGEIDHGVIPGRNPGLMQWDGLWVGGAICYDMNFPELFARQRDEGVDLFICPSLFPGGNLLNYYAHVHEVPIVLAYPAWSRIIDPIGEEIVEGGLRHETLRWGSGSPVYIADINFDYEVVMDCSREIVLEIERKYAGRIGVRLHQHNCVYHVESLTDDLTAREVLDEFGLSTRRESLQDGMRRIDAARGAI
ncbi:MAG: hypothetical protein CMJ18_06965 [Phycisphaeraceae bacterium]|nr:hypothetical protein [Phycisphaeraceae bacterium]